MQNLYAQFRQLMPEPALQAGVVLDVFAGVATVQLPGGDRLKARGQAVVGQTVFVRDEAIEGVAPSLPMEVIEI